MNVARLLPASIAAPDAESRIDASSLAVARQRHLTDTALPQDGYIWSVAAGDDGSYIFYAVPRTSGAGSSALSDRQQRAANAGAWAAPASNTGATLLEPRDVAGYYAFYASLAAPATTGRFLNLYA